MEIDPATNGNTDAVMAEFTPTITPSPLVPASRLSQLTESLKLEHQLLRVPFEHFFLDKEDSADVENITKLKRFLVDYPLRMSYFETASKLSETRNISNLVDIDIFREAKKVVDALKCSEVASALTWCADNKTRLKKSKSKFEFQLRLQEFIELVRADNYKQAILYARKHLAPWGATHMNELQHVLASLAFKSTTESTKYMVKTSLF